MPCRPVYRPCPVFPIGIGFFRKTAMETIFDPRTRNVPCAAVFLAARIVTVYISMSRKIYTGTARKIRLSRISGAAARAAAPCRAGASAARAEMHWLNAVVQDTRSACGPKGGGYPCDGLRYLLGSAFDDAVSGAVPRRSDFLTRSLIQKPQRPP